MHARTHAHMLGWWMEWGMGGGGGVSMKIAHIVIITNMAMKFNCYTKKYTLTDINFSCRQFSSMF